MYRKKLANVLFVNLIVMLLIFLQLEIISYAENKQIILKSINVKNSRSIKVNNTIYMPAKIIFEAFEWQVNWDSVSKKVICTNGNKIIAFENNSSEVLMDNEYYHMESPFIIVGNIGYVPQKFIVEQFGVKVRWNKKDNIVLLSTNNAQSISVNGSSNIVIVGEGIIANIFEPCSKDTINDMLDIADKLLSISPHDALQKYEEIIDNFSPEDMPDLYAHIMNNMGNAYITIAEYKDTRQNISRAIDSYVKAMDYFKANGDNADICTLLINLGNAYRTLSDLDNCQNSAESSINLYKEALKRISADDYPLDYAMIQYNMGLSYNQAGSEKNASNCLKIARDIYEKSLDIYTLSEDPQTYATIRYNLGNIYRHLWRTEDFFVFEKAKKNYEQVLNVWTSESFPLYYAKVNACLGMLYSKLYAENKSYNSYENARLRFKESLRLITMERYPVNFAKTNMELGNLFIIAWEYTKNEELYYNAVYCYENSLKVFTSSGYQKYYSNLTANLKVPIIKNRLINAFTYRREKDEKIYN